MKMQSDRNQYPCSRTFDLWTFVPLTSYSCESFRLSLALRSSVCSASSEMGMGGWFIIPAHQTKTINIHPGEEKEESPLAKQKNNSKTLTTGDLPWTQRWNTNFSAWEACEEHSEFHTKKKKNSDWTRPELKEFCSTSAGQRMKCLNL